MRRLYERNRILFCGASATGVLSFASVVALLVGKVTIAVAAVPIAFHVVYVLLILGKNFKLGREGIEVSDDDDDQRKDTDAPETDLHAPAQDCELPSSKLDPD